MSSKRIAAGFILIVTLFAVSVFGGEITAFVEKVPAMFVTNDDAHAVPVRDVGDPGRYAFSFFENANIEDGDETHVSTFTVPEGKRLVIESISIDALLPAGQDLIGTVVQGRVNGHVYVHALIPEFLGRSTTGRDRFAASALRRLYADGGTEVVLFATRGSRDESAITNANVAGYLIDCESGACK